MKSAQIYAQINFEYLLRYLYNNPFTVAFYVVLFNFWVINVPFRML